MNFYWVNQSHSFLEELELQCLWASLMDKENAVPSHWKLMWELDRGDIVINYSNGVIKGFSIVLSKPYNSPKPNELKKLDYPNDGVKCDLKYNIFENPVLKADLIKAGYDLLSFKNSPFNIKGNLNQGYLFKSSATIFNYLLQKSYYPYSLQEIENQGRKTETDFKGKRRIGHEGYRRKVFELWQGKCPITGLNKSNLLVASHIVAWKDSDDKERLDPYNSILLSPLYDSLFDRYYISFNKKGEIILSKRISKEEFLKIGVTALEKIILFQNSIPYLERHTKIMKSLE